MTKPLLVAFDFDHTIVDDNTDIVVRKLLPDEKLPDSVRGLYKSTGWTDYMAKVFELLHENNIQIDKILDSVTEIPSVAGVENLLKQLHALDSEIIIISDSNSLFIEKWLEHKNLDTIVSRVITNPAKVAESGLLTIEKYHLQDWCKLSSINLCKGHILESYIEERGNQGVLFQRVAYVGDGQNDLCPVLRLSKKDLAFPRLEYALVKLLNGGNDNSKVPLPKCKIVPWKNGDDILEKLK